MFPRSRRMSAPAGAALVRGLESLEDRVVPADYTISSVAGLNPEGIPATEAALKDPHGLVLDATGNLFIADSGNLRIRRVDHATGAITTAAGGGGTPVIILDGFTTSVPGTSASLFSAHGPRGIAMNTSGDLFVTADSASFSTVARLSPDGILHAIRLTNTSQMISDYVSGSALDAAGDLYLADTGNSVIERIDFATGVVTVVVGSETGGNGGGFAGFAGDGGPAANAKLRAPSSLAFDAAGNMFITDTGNNRIRRVDAATGIITTIAGDGTAGFTGDNGLASLAKLSAPAAVTFDAGGNLFIADTGNNRIRRIDYLTGFITTVVGNGTAGFSGDGGLATAAGLQAPAGLFVDSAGNLYVADSGDNRVRRVDHVTGVIVTVAGNGEEGFNDGFSGDGTAATGSTLFAPAGVATDAAGNVYIADSSNNRVRRVDHAAGVITTVAGNGTAGFTGDGGPASRGELDNPSGVSLDAAGNLFIADRNNQRIRRVDAVTGLITTVAGNGLVGFTGDGGPATDADLDFPTWLAADAAGNVYVSDGAHSRVRRIDHISGNITTVAGNGADGFTGDGGLATAATLFGPGGIALDAAGNLFIADRGNQRVRRVDAVTGVVTTAAGFEGNAFPQGHGSGPSGAPYAVAVDAAGRLFVLDSDSGQVFRVDAATGKLTAVAAAIGGGLFGDGGLAAYAQLNFPAGLAVDGTGNLLVADTGNNLVRKISLQPATTVTLAQTSLPPGVDGQPYTQTLTANGGTRPYTYAVTAGSLPASLTLSAGGVLSGTLQSSSLVYTFTAAFTVTASDSAGQKGTQSYSIQVAPAPGVSPGTGGTTFSISTHYSTQLVITDVAAATDEEVATHVVGQYRGAVVFDQVVPVSNDPADPAIQAALAAARAAVLAAGATAVTDGAVGPAVRNRTGSRFTTVETGRSSTTIDGTPTTETTIGPKTIRVGEDRSDTRLIVRGNTNINVIVQYLTTVDQTRTTTDTFTTTTTLTLDGVAPMNSHVYLLAVGADAGGGPRVRATTPDGTVALDVYAFERSFSGGVRVATGDVTGDGVDDVLTAAGDGGGPRIRILDGATGATVRDFFAFPDTLRVGVFVSASDVNGDGFADYAVTAGLGGGPRVALFDGKTGERLRDDFLAFDADSRTGFTVALGPVLPGGRMGVAVGRLKDGSEVRVFDLSGELVSGFAAYEAFAGGVDISVGDADGNGTSELIIGSGPGGGPRVRAFDVNVGQAPTEVRNSFIFAVESRNGVRVGTGTGDGSEALLVAGLGGVTRTAVAGEQFVGDESAPFGPTWMGGVWLS